MIPNCARKNNVSIQGRTMKAYMNSNVIKIMLSSETSNQIRTIEFNDVTAAAEWAMIQPNTSMKTSIQLKSRSSKRRSKWREEGITRTDCSIRSSLWLWWTTNKRSPTIVKSPKSAQIQCENLRRTGRRKSAGRRLIFHGSLPPIQHEIKNPNWPISQIQSKGRRSWSIESTITVGLNLDQVNRGCSVVRNAHLFIESKNPREGKE